MMYKAINGAIISGCHLIKKEMVYITANKVYFLWVSAQKLKIKKGAKYISINFNAILPKIKERCINTVILISFVQSQKIREDKKRNPIIDRLIDFSNPIPTKRENLIELSNITEVSGGYISPLALNPSAKPYVSALIAHCFQNLISPVPGVFTNTNVVRISKMTIKKVDKFKIIFD